MENLLLQDAVGLRKTTEAQGRLTRPPYPPDFNPTEEAELKVK
jgi:transposase